ncbi:peptidase, M61 (glycyl aminopeptidase) family protein [Verrucomicrobiia bacterium DG1235]|nr:peptidase, M61 (glycyl aminopeptidase) family protein [Verrucomicrobiae bacterium DG1235]
MNRLLLFLLSLTTLASASLLHAKPLSISLDVDATQITRKLVNSRLTFETSPGELVLRYPEWVPGVHAPRGPIQNLGGLRVTDDKGQTVNWERDPKDRYRFLVDVPKGSRSVTVAIDYICSQPSTNSNGVDSFGNSFVGIINWNTLLVYPESHPLAEVEVTTQLTLPNGWKLGCAIASNQDDSGIWNLDTVNIEQLVDSPIIMGENFRSFELEAADFPKTNLHVTSESAAALMAPDETIEKFGKLASEAGLLFGGAHFEQYDFLLVCSDQLPFNGLEHLKSSYNSVSERFFLEEDKLKGWEGYLLPHEFVHSWCGKYRRPEGMLTHDFHTVKDTRLLWVYEGLTQHLGEVLTVRSGIWDIDHFKQLLAGKISYLRSIRGRQWRSLEDTAADAYHLRGWSRSWSSLRRGQDYYNEGLLFWLEVDAILRGETNSETTLDDFSKQFLGANYPGGEVLPFTEEDVVSELNKLLKYDWEELIENRITNTQESMPLDFVEKLGYKLKYSSEPTKAQKDREKDRNYASALDSLGMDVSKSGTVRSGLVIDMPAAAAGVSPGMKIIGVNDRKFSLDRFREAIADSVVRGKVTLLVEDGDRFRTIEIPYDGGLRYLELERDESKPDLIEAIYTPRLES